MARSRVRSFYLNCTLWTRDRHFSKGLIYWVTGLTVSVQSYRVLNGGHVLAVCLAVHELTVWYKCDSLQPFSNALWVIFDKIDSFTFGEIVYTCLAL